MWDIPMLTEIISRQCKRTRQAAAFAWSPKIDDREKFRETVRLLLDNGYHSEAVERLSDFAALASDIVPSEGSLGKTMFDLTSGNQRFLDSIRALAGEPEGQGGKPRLIPEDAVREALLGPWQYRDGDHALGWDPETQRLHALRHKLPEKDKANRSVRAAVFLATQALSLFPCFARGHEVYTSGFHDDDGQAWFSWPIWREPISLTTLRSLLTHPFTADLKHRGVEVVYRCRRVRTGGAEGNYQVFSYAEERQWPRS